MKTAYYVILAILLIGCHTENTEVPEKEDDCLMSPCTRPNINRILFLSLSFERYSDEELSPISVIRIRRADSSVIDTLELSLENKEMVIGSQGSVGFSEEMSGKTLEKAQLNYRILIQQGAKAFDITEIRVEKESKECECPRYFISTLQLDGKTIDINAPSYTLPL